MTAVQKRRRARQIVKKQHELTRLRAARIVAEALDTPWSPPKIEPVFYGAYK